MIALVKVAKKKASPRGERGSLRRPARPEPESEAARELRIQTAKHRLAPLLPEIDPGDLDLILRSLSRPFGQGRRFFLRQLRPGVYVF